VVVETCAEAFGVAALALELGHQAPGTGEDLQMTKHYSHVDLE